MAREEATFETKAKLKAKTDKAILVYVHDFDEDYWIPSGQVHDNSEIYDGCDVGETGNIVVTSWIAEKKGWI
jgi:hypothetical protein